MTVTRLALVAAMLALTVMPPSVRAEQGSRHDAKSCRVDVLYSEELPVGPLFYHTVKARLLVTPADRPPFETTVERVISWQAAPPRRGQRVYVSCDTVQGDSSFRLF
jgi:hypothetical protein